MKEVDPKPVNSPYVFVGGVLLKLEEVASVSKYTRLTDEKGYFSVGVGGIDRVISGSTDKTRAALRDLLLMLGFAE